MDTLNSNIIYSDSLYSTYIKYSNNYEFNLNNFINNTLKINIVDPKEKEQFISNFKNGILSNKELINTILIENKNDIIVEDKDFIYQFTTSDNQINNIYTNISNIILGNCETKIKNEYNIDENEPLLIFKIDKYSENSLISMVDMKYIILKQMNY